MNLFMNTKVFVIIGIGIMAGGVILAAVLQPQDTITQGDLPEVTSTLATEGTPEATPNSRQFSAAEDVVDPESTDYRAVITTDAGVIEIDLFEEIAPNTVNSFVFLANNGFFDNLRWHRVVDGFVTQTGDPLSAVERGSDVGVGSGGPGYQTEEEPNDLSNTRGTIAMAKSSGATSFGSQFFINLSDDNTFLDEGGGGDAFYPFGEVVSGMEVADQITQGDVIQSIEILEEPKSSSGSGDDEDQDEAGDEEATEDEAADEESENE